MNDDLFEGTCYIHSINNVVKKFRIVVVTQHCERSDHITFFFKEKYSYKSIKYLVIC